MNPICSRCNREHSDLIHLLWRCPKLHRYWSKVLDTLNRMFQANIGQNPKSCLLGIVDGLQVEEVTKQAIARALFQARKQILRLWNAVEPPSWKEYLETMGDMIRLEKNTYQHRGSSHKFQSLWSPWLDTPGLSRTDLILDRIL